MLEWAGERLATAEIAAVCGTAIEDVRPELEQLADPTPVGPEAYWSPSKEKSRSA